MRASLRRFVVEGKRLVRPLVPDAVIVRLRSGVAGPTLRYNLDLVVEDPSGRRRWARSTPAVFRVRSPESFGTRPPEATVTRTTEPPQMGDSIVAVSSMPLDESTRRRLLTPLADQAVDASFLAGVRQPAVNRTVIEEPAFDPVAVAIRKGALREVGGMPPGGNPLAGLLDRCRDAGQSIAVTPITPTRIPLPRLDPIDGVGSVVILAVVPVHDVGGGSRSAQMAQELAARGYHVTYVSVFPVDETVDMGVRYIHPGLEQHAITDWDVGDFLRRVVARDRIAILELPHWKLLRPVELLKAAGFRIVYDLIDDWSDPALGAWGFDPQTEEKTISLADGLVGSAPSLVRRLESMSGRPAIEVANGVNVRLFGPASFPSPADLPAGQGPVLEYHGSLYGNWLDWTSLARIASAIDDARVIVIGDEKQHPPMPANVFFLGLKPQYELPAYLAHTDVALVPFVVSDTTHAVSPLKVFEYLAMGVPVAAPPLEPLIGIHGVATDTDLVTAVRVALQGPRPDPTVAAEAHGWGARLERLFGTVGLTLGEDPSAPPMTYRRRPTRHWPDEERLVE